LIKTRMLNVTGIAVFEKWLSDPVGGLPPKELLDSDTMTDNFGDYEIDELKEFGSRFEFGCYLKERFDDADFNVLMSPDSDGLWHGLPLSISGN